jgi:beta-lactamase class D
MRVRLFTACVALVACVVMMRAQPPETPHSCILVQELSSSKPLYARGGAQCSTRLAPASTFKIPHALVALETGVVTTTSIEKWDGTKYPRQPKWNRNHTVISALRPSVLWVFQRIAPRIGASRMAQWLTRFNYGNQDTSGPIGEYWTNGRLTISPAEQLEFVRRFYGDELPVRAAHARAVRDGLQQQSGTMENSLGVHRLEGDWREAALNAKTGATSTPQYSVSWLVGVLRVKQTSYAFTSAVWAETGTGDTLGATRLAVRAFIDAGILPPAPLRDRRGPVVEKRRQRRAGK